MLRETYEALCMVPRSAPSKAIVILCPNSGLTAYILSKWQSLKQNHPTSLISFLILCGHFFILQYFQWSYHFPKSPLNLPCSPTFHSQQCQLSLPTDSPPSLQPILAAVPAHCSLNLPWKCTGILQNLSLKPHPPPS